eukprot:11993423-Heterocapsa_arctica.AAC.1
MTAALSICHWRSALHRLHESTSYGNLVTPPLWPGCWHAGGRRVLCVEARTAVTFSSAIAMLAALAGWSIQAVS